MLWFDSGPAVPRTMVWFKQSLELCNASLPCSPQLAGSECLYTREDAIGRASTLECMAHAYYTAHGTHMVHKRGYSGTCKHA